MPSVEVVGVYPVDADEPIHLVEVLIRDSPGKFDFTDFTQPAEGPRSDWQVPYDEKILDDKGESVFLDPWAGDDSSAWTGDVRLAFFFHYLDPAVPMLTPFGEVELPAPSDQPSRLSFMEYEEP